MVAPNHPFRSFSVLSRGSLRSFPLLTYPPAFSSITKSSYFYSNGRPALPAMHKSFQPLRAPGSPCNSGKVPVDNLCYSFGSILRISILFLRQTKKERTEGALPPTILIGRSMLPLTCHLKFIIRGYAVVTVQARHVAG
jgi:hypothetical protein